MLQRSVGEECRKEVLQKSGVSCAAARILSSFHDAGLCDGINMDENGFVFVFLQCIYGRNTCMNTKQFFDGLSLKRQLLLRMHSSRAAATSVAHGKTIG